MKNLSLNMKIVLVLSVFVVGSIIISYLGLSKMKEISHNLNHVVNNSAKRVDDAHTIKELFLTQLLNEKNYILATSKQEMQEQDERIIARDKQLRALMKSAFEESSQNGKQDLTMIQSHYDEWWTLMDEIKAFALVDDNKSATQISMVKGRALRLQIEDVLERIIERNTAEMQADKKSSDEVYENSRILMTSTSLIAITAGLLLAFLILRSLGKTITQVIESLNTNSLEVTSAAAQIASSSGELSQAAAEQASSLEQTAASIEEMSSMVQRNAENSERTSSLASSSHASANKGKEVLNEMIAAIGDITASNNAIMTQVEESNKQISDIVNVIAEIGNKTKVINDIVFQTKLLSFNASVEAARAGEHGKGFAVVAEEVGSLAQMSGNAAKEISDMLEDSMQKVEDIVENTKQRVGSIILEGQAKIEAGDRTARECESVFNEIVSNISTVNQMAGDISVASKEQAQGVQEITRAMSMLDQVTQTNSSTSQETASAAEQLSAQAESLQSTVSVLIHTIKGGTHQVRASKTKPETRVDNVVELKLPAPTKVLKRASGHDSIPQEDDPRFQEI